MLQRNEILTVKMNLMPHHLNQDWESYWSNFSLLGKKEWDRMLIPLMGFVVGFFFLSFSFLLFFRSIYRIYIELAFIDFSQKQVWHNLVCLMKVKFSFENNHYKDCFSTCEALLLGWLVLKVNKHHLLFIVCSLIVRRLHYKNATSLWVVEVMAIFYSFLSSIC